MDIKERLKLIERNTAEIIGRDELLKLLKKKKNPVIYWGTAPTGKPHVGYLLPSLKIADLLKAGFKVKILLADLHAALDNTPWIILEKRYDYYAKIIPLMVQALGVEIKNLEIVKGSEFQLKPEYMYDVLKMSSETSVRDAKKAGSEVVKQADNPRVSGLIYPLMQAVDEEYLGADAQLGGTDQRKIMVLAREKLQKIGYKQRIEILNPLLPGLIGKKMSASDEKSKIDLLDDEETIQQKVKNAEMVAGDIENGILPFLNHVVMTIKQDRGEKFIIERSEKFGGNLEYSEYEEIEKDFKSKKLHPLDLKNAVAKEIYNIIKPIQKHRKELEGLAKKHMKTKWPNRLVIIRHGESEHNYVLDTLHKSASKEALEKLSKIRDADIVLTDKGKNQAKKTGKYLKELFGESFDICFISPYMRTIQTSEGILSGFNKKIKSFEDIRLREKEFGRLHGLTTKQIREKFPFEARAREIEGKFYYRLLGGENYPDVAMRVHSFMDKLVRDYSGKNVLIVTHQVVYKLFRFWFEHLSEKQILDLPDAPNCAIQVYENKSGKMKLVSYDNIGY